MRRLQRRLFALVISMVLLCTMSMMALAHEAVDMTKEGSITLAMREGEAAVPGGTMTLYRVGAVSEDNGDYCFVLTGDFAACEASLEDITSGEPAADLAAYAGVQKLSGDTLDIDKDGKVTFTGLEVGLYLLLQEKPAEGYRSIEPFLVSVPMEEQGSYRYDVDASPKVAPEKAPVEPTSPSAPTTPGGPILPQTGQLNWPIPVLVVLGLGLFAAGWILRKKNDNEA